MNTNDPSPSSAARLVTPLECRANARLYASAYVMELLDDLSRKPRVAVFVDVDALERSALARIDRVMVLALNGLCQVNVQVVLVARGEHQRAARLQREIFQSWWLKHSMPQRVLAQVRDRLPGVPLLAISDDPLLLAQLSKDDRGIGLGANITRGSSNIAVSSDLNVRAALWWLVDIRSKAGMASRA
jgi:hypothetical protein